MAGADLIDRYRAMTRCKLFGLGQRAGNWRLVVCQKFKRNPQLSLRFLGCLKRQLGTISAAIRQSWPKPSPILTGSHA
jgi:hypothetical protein